MSKHTPGAERLAAYWVTTTRSKYADKMRDDLARAVDVHTGLPELLEALEHLISHVLGPLQENGYEVAHDIGWDMALAAIAKANGEAR